MVVVAGWLSRGWLLRTTAAAGRDCSSIVRAIAEDFVAIDRRRAARMSCIFGYFRTWNSNVGQVCVIFFVYCDFLMKTGWMNLRLKGWTSECKFNLCFVTWMEILTFCGAAGLSWLKEWNCIYVRSVGTDSVGGVGVLRIFWYHPFTYHCVCLVVRKKVTFFCSYLFIC